MIVKCKCGCGKEFSEFDSRKRRREYVSGHNKSTKGKDCRITAKCETCKKEYKFYKSCSKGRFCSRKCQHEFDYPGSYWIQKNGYMCYERKGKKKLVHRMIAGAKQGQVVHHKDGNPLNNGIENLAVLSGQSEHIKIHNPVMARWKKTCKYARAAHA